MKKNRLISIFVAVFLLLSMTFSVSAASFTDVSEETHPWAINDIKLMSEKGVIKGYSDNTFRPDNTVSKLEALALTARILGCEAPENELLLDAGIEAYSEMLEQFELTFGVEEICFLLIKDIISADELDEYLDSGNASSGMKRYEMATLLTKALDAEEEVSKNLITNLDFNDADEIPSYAKKYVEYVSKNGIMNGVGENSFSPNTTVTRAQVAILMNKLSQKTNYSYYSGVVADMDSASRVITVKTDNKDLKYTVNSNVILRFEGAEITANDIAPGYDAVVTLKDEALYSIDFITPLVDKTVNGAIVATASGKNTSVSIYVIGDDDVDVSTDIKETYPLAENVVITYNDAPASVLDLKSGLFANVVVKKGEAVVVRAYDKTKTVSGKIINVEVTPVCKFTVEHDDGTIASYIVSSNVEVSRNGSKKTAADVAQGDTVTLTTVYNRISKVIATGKQQTKSGIISEVIISANPKITVKSSDGTQTYSIKNDCVINLPGVDTPTFYDLRVGVTVELTLESETVVKLSAGVSEGVTQINGTVSSVNASYSLIQVSYIDPITGVSVIEPVFVKTKTTIIDILTGKAIKLSAIKPGAKIAAFGLRNNGVFEATTVNITNN